MWSRPTEWGRYTRFTSAARRCSGELFNNCSTFTNSSDLLLVPPPPQTLQSAGTDATSLESVSRCSWIIWRDFFSFVLFSSPLSCACILRSDVKTLNNQLLLPPWAKSNPGFFVFLHRDLPTARVQTCRGGVLNYSLWCSLGWVGPHN